VPLHEAERILRRIATRCLTGAMLSHRSYNVQRGMVGARTADLEARRQQKIRQLLANPYGADGYVVVVGFAARRVIFSFHHNDRGAP
jgi:hypothetical protein